LPDEHSWEQIRLLALEKLSRFSGPGFDELKRVLRSKDPRGIWTLADSDLEIDGERFGKKFLLGKSWRGYLDLSDRESMDRFWTYVGRGQASAARRLTPDDFATVMRGKKYAPADSIDQRFIDQWERHMGAMPPARLAERMTEGVDAEIADIMFSPDGTFMTMSSELRIGGRAAGFMDRRFYITEGIVEHARFVVEEWAQAKGLGKKILKNSVRLYEELGLKKVRLEANIDIGGYAWARYGMVPNYQSWVMLREDALARLEGASGPAVDQLRKILERDDPKAIWDLADSDARVYGDERFGKKFLMGRSWVGELDLSDRESMERFWNYVGGR
jgi:hypothetical protein